MQSKLLFLLLVIIFGSQKVKPAVSGDSTELRNAENSNQNRPQQPQKALTTEATYTGDICTNILGGIRTGTVYLGMANMKAGFNTQNARLWKGGQFFIHGAITHGTSPTKILTGDFQVVSNMDAGNHIYIHELWYSQTFERFEITFGLQDLNVEFAGSENGSLFLNSSFGIPSVISDNIPAPIFPLTALGLTYKIKLSEEVSLNGAVYDGCPTAFDQNVNNTNWQLCNNDGALIFNELQWSTTINNLPGTYKAGNYYHTGLKVTDPETGILTTVFDKNYGFYLITDQTLWQKDATTQKINLFAQLTLSPASINTHHYYIGGGLNYQGISKTLPADAIGIAFACAGFKKSYRKNETTIEVFYKKKVCDKLFIQPDFQFIIHPAGTIEALPNAFVGIMRFSLNF